MPGWYDHAEAYDVLCSWDPQKERDFLLQACERWGRGGPRRALEPFCGSGRMLRALGDRAVGFDVNENMLRVAARRSRVFRADAARFAVRAGAFDLAFALIDSFRYLLREEDAHGHLRCVARALEPGGIYVVGFDVTGGGPPDVSRETWTRERDGVRVQGDVGGLGDRDQTTRIETVRVRLDIERDGKSERLEDLQPMRVYAPDDVEELVAREGSFRVASVHDRHYDVDRPVDLDALYGSAVIVLRRCQAWQATCATPSQASS